MSSHVPQPEICLECRKMLGTTIARNPKPTVNLTWCPHAETLAKVNIENGVVVRWEMARPVSEAQAREIMRQQGELMREAAAGGKLS